MYSCARGGSWVTQKTWELKCRGPCMVGRCAGDGARAVIVGAEKRWCRPCIVVVGAQRGEGCIVGRYAGVEIMRESQPHLP